MNDRVGCVQTDARLVRRISSCRGATTAQELRWLASRSLSSVTGVGPPTLALRARLRRAAFVCNRERRLVSLNFTSWNQIGEWLKRLDAIRSAAGSGRDRYCRTPLNAQLPIETIGVTPVRDRHCREADDCDCAKDLVTERARKRELKNDHNGAEQEEMPGAPRIHVIPHRVVSKCGGYAESVESIARNPPEEQRNRHENQHRAERFHAS